MGFAVTKNTRPKDVPCTQAPILKKITTPQRNNISKIDVKHTLKNHLTLTL